LDRERVTVAASLGIRARTAMEWLKMAYDTTGLTCMKPFTTNRLLCIQAPHFEPPLHHRRRADEPGAIASFGNVSAFRSGASTASSAGMYHPPHRLLPRGRTVDKWGLGMERQRADSLRDGSKC